MQMDAIMGAAGVAPAQQFGGAGGPAAFSVSDQVSFQSALSGANGPAPVAPPAVDSADAVSPAIKGVFTSLERVNGEAQRVAEYAAKASAAGSDMTPGEVIQLTMRCHEFMFHCQLSSSIANRTSDGLQQLFRQQS